MDFSEEEDDNDSVFIVDDDVFQFNFEFYFNLN